MVCEMWDDCCSRGGFLSGRHKTLYRCETVVATRFMGTCYDRMNPATVLMGSLETGNFFVGHPARNAWCFPWSWKMHIRVYSCLCLGLCNEIFGPTVYSTGTDSWRPCWRAWGGVPAPVSKDNVPHSGRASAEIAMQCMEIKVLIAKDVTTSKMCRNLCESITSLLVLVSCTLNYFSCREQGGQPAVISRFGKVSAQYWHRC